MSRLTKRIGESGVFYPHCENCEDGKCACCAFDEEIAKKLAHYEDLEEQGRLIKIVRCRDCEHFKPTCFSAILGRCMKYNFLKYEYGYCDGAEAKLAEIRKEK